MTGPPAGGDRSARRPLDANALSRVLLRLGRADAPPWLHTEVARRMAERLPVIRQQPAVVLDWWAHLSGSGTALRAAYPRALIVPVQTVSVQTQTQPAALVAANKSPGWWSALRRTATGAGAAAPAPGRSPDGIDEDAVAAGGAELVWANMVLHGSIDPQRTMAQWHRALAVDGFLMFSTLGPGTFDRLTTLYAANGWQRPFAPFVDMHDLGDMLLHAGFADPVMDQQQVTLTWPDAPALLAELRTLGGNVALGRHAGLRTPGWRRQLLQALQGTAGADGRPALQVELVYGHAFRPPPRPPVSGLTAVPLDEMRAMVRAGRRAG